MHCLFSLLSGLFPCFDVFGTWMHLHVSDISKIKINICRIIIADCFLEFIIIFC